MGYCGEGDCWFLGGSLVGTLTGFELGVGLQLIDLTLLVRGIHHEKQTKPRRSQGAKPHNVQTHVDSVDLYGRTRQVHNRPNANLSEMWKAKPLHKDVSHQVHFQTASPATAKPKSKHQPGHRASADNKTFAYGSDSQLTIVGKFDTTIAFKDKYKDTTIMSCKGAMVLC